VILFGIDSRIGEGRRERKYLPKGRQSAFRRLAGKGGGGKGVLARPGGDSEVSVAGKNLRIWKSDFQGWLKGRWGGRRGENAGYLSALLGRK